MYNFGTCSRHVLDSIVVSIPACHAGDRGSIPRRGGENIFSLRFAFLMQITTIFQRSWSSIQMEMVSYDKDCIARIRKLWLAFQRRKKTFYGP